MIKTMKQIIFLMVGIICVAAFQSCGQSGGSPELQLIADEPQIEADEDNKSPDEIPIEVKRKDHVCGETFKCRNYCASKISIVDGDIPYEIDLEIKAINNKASAEGWYNSTNRLQAIAPYEAALEEYNSCVNSMASEQLSSEMLPEIAENKPFCISDSNCARYCERSFRQPIDADYLRDADRICSMDGYTNYCAEYVYWKHYEKLYYECTLGPIDEVI